MKRRDLLKLVPLVAFAGIAAGLARADDAIGSVSQVSGSASAERQKKSRSLKIKSGVFIGDEVATAPDARLGLKLAGKTTLRLGGSTKVMIDKYVANSGGVLSIGEGALLFDGPDGGFPKGLKVESPFALLAVRGTKFYAGELDGVFSVFVERGIVGVMAGGAAVRLKAGDGTVIKRRGAPPGAVKRWKGPKIAKFEALFR